MNRSTTCPSRARALVVISQFASEDDQREFLPPGNAGCARLLSLQDTQLVPQEQDLKVFVLLGSTAYPEEVDQ